MTTDSLVPAGLRAWAVWCEERERAAMAVPGNLALVAFQAVTETPAPVEAVPGLSVSRPPGVAGAVLEAPAAADVTVDGATLDGAAEVGTLRPDGTPLVRCGGRCLDVFSSDGTDVELRIYDPDAPNRTRFAGIDAYPYDAGWELPARFAPYPEASTTPWGFTREADTGHAKRVPGTIALEIAGTAYELLAFLDGEALVLVFADATTGSESSEPGRFVRLARPAPDAPFALDFNRAFVPPCGFSDHYSCPVPPPQNRIAVRVDAGERRARWL